jgi:hypothetical protein
MNHYAPNIYVHLLSTLDDADFYNVCKTSPQMRNVCMNDPVLYRRFQILEAKYTGKPSMRM